MTSLSRNFNRFYFWQLKFVVCAAKRDIFIQDRCCHLAMCLHLNEPHWKEIVKYGNTIVIWLFLVACILASSPRPGPTKNFQSCNLTNHRAQKGHVTDVIGQIPALSKTIRWFLCIGLGPSCSEFDSRKFFGCSQSKLTVQLVRGKRRANV